VPEAGYQIIGCQWQESAEVDIHNLKVSRLKLFEKFETLKVVRCFKPDASSGSRGYASAVLICGRTKRSTIGSRAKLLMQDDQ